MTNLNPKGVAAASSTRPRRVSSAALIHVCWGSSAFAGACTQTPIAASAAAATSFVVQQPSVRRRVRRTHVLLQPSSNIEDAGESDADKSRRIKNVRRIFAISDPHTDSAENMQWLIDRCCHAENAAGGISNDNDGINASSHAQPTPGPNDVLIIAGDISHDLDIIHKTLSTIVNNLQCHTFFIPGNHEAWIGGSKMDGMGLKDSFAKLNKVVEVCDALGVHTTAKLVVGFCSDANVDDDTDDSNNSRHPVWIVPMWSWYDGSLALPGCEDLSAGLATWPWVDFKRCEWGEAYQGTRLHETPDEDDVDARFTVPGCERVPPKELITLFLSWNNRSFEIAKQSPVNNVITFSHFLPSHQTLPDWKVPTSDVFRREEWLDHPVPDVSAKFAYVAGSELIDKQIRSLWSENARSPSLISDAKKSHIHVFGHSHRPKDFILDGIRYIHNPVGKPVEREMNMINDNFDFQLIWDCQKGEIRSENDIVRYWEQYGGGVELLAENMAKRRHRKKFQINTRAKEV